MGFRPPLDLDDFIEAYEPWLHGRSKAGVDYGSFGSARESTVVLSHTLEPLLVGAGPDTCSTCTDLIQYPEIIWDVNNYYGLLGITDYRSSRQEVRKAFSKFANEFGDFTDVKIINAYKQLIDPEIRLRYDATPLGERFLDDPLIQQEIKQEAQIKANQRQKDGEDISTKDILNEMGFDTEEVSEETKAEVDPVELTQEEPMPEFFDWGYSYYLWKSISMEEEPLAEWQEMIHRELANQKQIVNFAVGWRGGLDDHKWVIKKVFDTWVIFLSEKVSIKGVSGKVEAAEAARQLLQMIKSNK